MMKKTLKIVVLAKQVPDTRNVGKDAMKADGTVNRAALAAIFNPEDLNALEQALVLKDMFPGSRVEILTMGPGRAAEIIREGMCRGADGGVLLTDRKFAGSDTLATSYALSRAALKMNPDIIVAGRQAIDGDTAQVGPQVAEKLNWPQVTYAEEIVGIEGDELLIRRRLEHGVETVACRLPLVMTVNGTAPECRARHGLGGQPQFGLRRRRGCAGGPQRGAGGVPQCEDQRRGAEGPCRGRCADRRGRGAGRRSRASRSGGLADRRI